MLTSMSCCCCSSKANEGIHSSCLGRCLRHAFVSQGTLSSACDSPLGCYPCTLQLLCMIGQSHSITACTGRSPYSITTCTAFSYLEQFVRVMPHPSIVAEPCNTAPTPQPFLQVFENGASYVVVSFDTDAAMEKGDVTEYMNELARLNSVPGSWQLCKSAPHWGLVQVLPSHHCNACTPMNSPYYDTFACHVPHMPLFPHLCPHWGLVQVLPPSLQCMSLNEQFVLWHACIVCAPCVSHLCPESTGGACF